MTVIAKIIEITILHFVVGAVLVFGVGCFIADGWPPYEVRTGMAGAYAIWVAVGVFFVIPVVVKSWCDSEGE